MTTARADQVRWEAYKRAQRAAEAGLDPAEGDLAPLADWEREDITDTLRRARRRKERRCLKCGNPFMSDGPHNRMCQPCRDQTEYLN